MLNFVYLILSILIAETGWAYPELIRHSYSSCTSCHVSPYGGGLLNDYGRSLSKEVLSWNAQTSGGDSSKETEGVVSQWLLGGDARGAFILKQNEFEKLFLMTPMQAQLEGAYNQDAFAVVARGGMVFKEEQEFLSFLPTFYGLYRFTDEWGLRAGRFLPAYGLNNSLHFISTRGPLGFGFDDQRFAAELSYIADKVSVFITAAGTRGSSQLGKNSQGLQLQWGPTERSRLALNVWRESEQREIVGVWGIVPFGEQFYLLGDYNLQSELKKYRGYFSYFKFGYEWQQGLHFYWMHDQAQSDEKLSYTFQRKTGPGIQFFPAQHYEIDLAVLKEQNKLFSDKTGDYAYVLFHYYL